MVTDAVVQVVGASRIHGTVEVLPPTSFEVTAGRAAVVVGSNGSGKTTHLLHVTP
jgi:ABC-type branched-subunit amino acid transport system ATPase component